MEQANEQDAVRRMTVLSCFRLAAPCVALMLAAAASAPAETPVNERARLLKEFSDRATEYVELQRKAQSMAPPLPRKSTPEQISAHEKALTGAVRVRRAGA